MQTDTFVKPNTQVDENKANYTCTPQCLCFDGHIESELHFMVSADPLNGGTRLERLSLLCPKDLIQTDTFHNNPKN